MTKLRTLLALSALGLGALWAQSSATNDAVTRVVRATVANDRDDGIAASWQALLDDLFREIDDRLDREGEQMLARRRADIRNGASSGAAGSTTAGGIGSGSTTASTRTSTGGACACNGVATS